MIAQIEADLEEVKHHLAHLTDYSIEWYKNLRGQIRKGKRTPHHPPWRPLRPDRLWPTMPSSTSIGRRLIGMASRRTSSSAIVPTLTISLPSGRMAPSAWCGSMRRVLLGRTSSTSVWNKKDDRTTYHLVYFDGDSGNATSSGSMSPP